MRIVSALAGVVIKEMYRRKDFYVLFVLTAVITIMLGSVNFFNDRKAGDYLKEACLLLVWVSALVIAITTAARQIPAERENRTIFPLLAKPVTRAHLILGKFVGCWLACGLALVVFYFFLGVISASREHALPLISYLQAFLLQWAMLGVVVAMALLGSVVFTAPSATATFCFIVVTGILLLGRYLNQVALQMPEPRRTLLYTLYFLIPHLEWFDVRDFVIYSHVRASWIACGLAALYAAAYSTFLLYATWLVFRRKPLST
jgi:Cu-processing system permease protein